MYMRTFSLIKYQFYFIFLLNINEIDLILILGLNAINELD